MNYKTNIYINTTICFILTLLMLGSANQGNLNQCFGPFRKANCQSLGLYKFPNNIHNETTNIDLHNNFIKELNENDFSGLPHLKTIFLDNNKLTKVERYVLKYLNKIKFLYLNNNTISNIKLESPSLYSLTLANNNNLKHFELYLPNLKILEISECGLTNLDENAFNFTLKLVKINISFNSLEFINKHVFINLKYLSNLDIRGNPIKRWTFIFAALPDANSLVLGQVLKDQNQICDESFLQINITCKCEENKSNCDIIFTQFKPNVLPKCIMCGRNNNTQIIKSLEEENETLFITQICLAIAVILLGLVIFIIIRYLRTQQNFDKFHF